MPYSVKNVKLVIIVIICSVICGVVCLQPFAREYIYNYLKGNILVLFDKLFPPDTVSVIYPSRPLLYKRPYLNADMTTIHCGNMLLYIPKKDETLEEIASKFIGFTYYFKTTHLQEAIKKLNAITNRTVKAGHVIVIPHPLPFIIIDNTKRSMTPIPYVKGVYYSGNSLGKRSMLDKLKELQSVGVNAIVFDVKDVCGVVNYKSHVPIVVELNTHEKRPVDDIATLIRHFKELNLYVIARIAVFRDHLLTKKKPEWAIISKSTGRVWNEGSKELWVDPTNTDVWDYNIALAREIAQLGADEVQFDYIRFPVSGNLSDTQFSYKCGKKTKVEVITEFLSKAKYELHALHTPVSIDIFGVVAWQKNEDISQLGQNIALLSQHCDVISPMLYPSHFNDNFDGYAKPGDHPYYFISTGILKVKNIAPNALIRPWLQAFKWRVSNYNEEYILSQIQACIDTNAFGYLFWNAANDYATVYRAFLKKQHKGKSIYESKR